MDDGTGAMQPLICRTSRAKAFWLFAGSLAFVGCGVFILVAPEPQGSFLFGAGATAAAAWVGIPFFGACAVLAFRRFLDSRPSLVIDEQGIFDRTLGVGVIPWSEIVDTRIRSVIGNKFICVAVRQPRMWLRRLSPLKRAIAIVNEASGFTRGELVVNLSSLAATAVEVHEFILKAVATDEIRELQATAVEEGLKENRTLPASAAVIPKDRGQQAPPEPTGNSVSQGTPAPRSAASPMLQPTLKPAGRVLTLAVVVIAIGAVVAAFRGRSSIPGESHEASASSASGWKTEAKSGPTAAKAHRLLNLKHAIANHAKIHPVVTTVLIDWQPLMFTDGSDAVIGRSGVRCTAPNDGLGCSPLVQALVLHPRSGVGYYRSLPYVPDEAIYIGRAQGFRLGLATHDMIYVYETETPVLLARLWDEMHSLDKSVDDAEYRAEYSKEKNRPISPDLLREFDAIDAQLMGRCAVCMNDLSSAHARDYKVRAEDFGLAETQVSPAPVDTKTGKSLAVVGAGEAGKDVKYFPPLGGERGRGYLSEGYDPEFLHKINSEAPVSPAATTTLENARAMTHPTAIPENTVEVVQSENKSAERATSESRQVEDRHEADERRKGETATPRARQTELRKLEADRVRAAKHAQIAAARHVNLRGPLFGCDDPRTRTEGSLTSARLLLTLKIGPYDSYAPDRNEEFVIFRQEDDVEVTGAATVQELCGNVAPRNWPIVTIDGWSCGDEAEVRALPEELQKTGKRAIRRQLPCVARIDVLEMKHDRTNSWP